MRRATMRLKESVIRKIIKEEAKRVMREAAFPEEVEAVYGKPPPEMEDEFSSSHSSSTMDPVGLVEKYMTHIEDLFVGGYDHEDSMSEAEGMIDDLCEELKDSMHIWLREHLMENEADRGEHDRDMAEDR
jgi:hypothetical protein